MLAEMGDHEMAPPFDTPGGVVGLQRLVLDGDVAHTRDRFPNARPDAPGEKVAAYCLNLDHEIGGPKAEGFRRILGIESADLEYLTEPLCTGILAAPIADVRDNAPSSISRTPAVAPKLALGAVRGLSAKGSGVKHLA